MEKSIPRISMEPESEGEPSKAKCEKEGEKESGLEVGGEAKGATSTIKDEPEEDQLMGSADASPRPGSGKVEGVPPPSGEPGSATPEIEDPLAKVRSSFGLPPRAGLRETSQE
jgi:hypothetical protein